jgi:hypothetical protein
MAAMPRERIDRERRLVPSSTIFLKVKSRLRALLEVVPACGRQTSSARKIAALLSR